MLQVRLDQVKRSLPAALKGVVQFEILTRGGTTEFYHLIVDGPKTVGGLGIVGGDDVWVNTSEEELEELLFDEGEVPGALRASGKVELFTGLLDAIAKQAGPATPLSVRTKKS